MVIGLLHRVCAGVRHCTSGDRCSIVIAFSGGTISVIRIGGYQRGDQQYIALKTEGKLDVCSHLVSKRKKFVECKGSNRR